MKHFALVGNPNCGKTTLFNALTGSTAHVGNWPGVTVDKREGLYKKLSEEAYVVDLPGIYSLSPYTSEEVISRNYILNEHPDCVINIVDATNLERNLYLTTQVLEMDVPVVIALNLMDVLEAQGEEIDTKLLSERIGVPVVLISAVNGKGIDELMNVAYLASQNKRLGTSVLSDSAIGHLVKDVNTAFKGLEVEHPLFHTLKLIENDELEVADHPQLVKVVDEFKLQFNDDIFGTDLEAVVADARYKYITKNFSPTKKSLRVNNTNTLSKSDKVDRVLTNKYLGIPIFIIILFVMFHLTFSENFLFLGGIFKSKGIEPFAKGSVFEGLFWTENGINSPGVILQSFVESVAGWFTDLVKGWLVNSPSWLSGFIADGCLAGVFSVLSFLPQILLLFAFFSILEDSGYMARVAFILDRIFRKFGLSGRSFMPMIMGFGCSVPAMINTRTLSDENERVATIRVIPFFSCGAKLPILTAIAGAVVSMFGIGNADLISLGMYLIGMVTAVIAVLLMRNTVMRGKVSPFIMELPQYHRPGLKPLWLHIWDKGKHFVKKAFTIILASTIIIWFLQSFTFGWQYIEQVDLQSILNDVAATDAWKDLVVLTDDNALIDEATGFIKGLDETQNALFFDECLASYQEIISAPGYLSSADSILAGFGRLFQPLMTPLGFGSQLGSTGWVFVVAAVTGLIAKENVIATFAVMSAAVAPTVLHVEGATSDIFEQIYLASIDSEEGVAAASQMIIATGAKIPALIAFITFNMTTVPCTSAVATAKAELPKKNYATTILFWIVCSYVVSTIVYLVGSWWWTSLIVIALAALCVVAIHFINKSIDNKKALEA